MKTYQFPSLAEIEDFIWSDLYADGLQYLPPFQDAKGRWFLTYEIN